MTPFDESQKLVRCDILNERKETSTRLVEADTFELWSYLMTEKHGLQVSNPTLCLWVSMAEYQENEAIFASAGEIERVDRILLDLFDSDYGFSQTSIRYALHDETEKLVQILKSHVPDGLRDSKGCSVEIIEGMVVQQWRNAEQPNSLGLDTQLAS